MNDSGHPGGKVQVFDGSGRLVKLKQLNVGVNSIYLNGLPPGIYYLSVQDGANVTIQKILKNAKIW